MSKDKADNVRRADEKPTSVIGKWTDGKGTIEFKPNGAAVVTPPRDAPMQMKYGIENTTVILAGRSGEMPFVLVGDSLIAEDNRKFNRIDAKRP